MEELLIAIKVLGAMAFVGIFIWGHANYFWPRASQSEDARKLSALVFWLCLPLTFIPIIIIGCIGGTVNTVRTPGLGAFPRMGNEPDYVEHDVQGRETLRLTARPTVVIQQPVEWRPNSAWRRYVEPELWPGEETAETIMIHRS